MKLEKLRKKLLSDNKHKKEITEVIENFEKYVKLVAKRMSFETKDSKEEFKTEFSIIIGLLEACFVADDFQYELKDVKKFTDHDFNLLKIIEGFNHLNNIFVETMNLGLCVYFDKYIQHLKNLFEQELANKELIS